jgi:hypothetical protein
MNLVIKIPHLFDSFNGLRYPRWGGGGTLSNWENAEA